MDAIPRIGSADGTRVQDLRDDFALIIAEWERLSIEEPWHIDPSRYGPDGLHATIRAVLDVARWGGADAAAHERLVRAAAVHGQQRRSQGVSDDVLLREYHALRSAIWRSLGKSTMPAPVALASVLRLDVAVGVATSVAHRSYHREIATAEEWEADMLRQVDAVSRNLVDLLGHAART